ncbi:MAG: hypothetical protein CMM87_03845 [Rickettsiales bacterium]|nr:hypothetical protein [Rickettsiales bacterium]|tara:strand:+ start:4025 stop:4477 length:453 start_codon:yes stop_codon:yes gene_type:complete
MSYKSLKFLTLSIAIFALVGCDGKFSCSEKDTKSLIAKVNELLRKDLGVENDVFNDSIISIEKGYIAIKENHLDDQTAEKFIQYRASMHKNEESKQRYLERWKTKRPSTSTILEASLKMLQKSSGVPLSCSFVKVKSPTTGKGMKVISLI